MTTNQSEQIPRIGMFATVRNRRGIVSAVEPYDGETGRLHLVHLEYKDDQYPQDERLLWELEQPHARLLEPTALPDFISSDPMPAEDFDALLRASRWTATMPYLDPDKEGPLERLPVSSPFHGAVQIEDYQLVPLLKALRMPRVNLLIADDVGLGKTIEAGYILSELLLRRRIQRVLILTPASLRLQWRDEMWERFSLAFDLIDRAETHKLHKNLGMDANPWRSFSRIIASYYYLRQDDVLEEFLSACRTPEGSPHLPWDLLIVDECHNLMPSAMGNDSDLCRMLRLLAPQFEHRLFLSATPHNGHTRSFTGLLEILDPVRFSQTSELKPAEKERVQQIVVRRLKREINERSDPPKFCKRLRPRALPLLLSPEEIELSRAFANFRIEVRRLIAAGDRRRRRSGSFAVEILGKRLLSCPTAFAESWRRCKEGLAEVTAADDREVAAAERSVKQETGDDREAQAREATASSVVGAWLKNVADELQDEIEAIDQAIYRLGIDIEDGDPVEQDPKNDARYRALVDLIEELLRDGDNWRDDERLIVFTEYKTTLDYLIRRLRKMYEEERILTLFGGGGKNGMEEADRILVIDAFNDPDHRVRILLSTDAAAEGLNLQRTARYLLHFDCPWNPSKLEQRNGRLDRHSQARDVTIHHFVNDEDQDLRFLAHILNKANDIREDLGSANELFDEATYRRLVAGESVEVVQEDLDRRVELAKGRAAIDADDTIIPSARDGEIERDLNALASELDFDSDSMRDTLEAAMAIRVGRPQLEASIEEGAYKIINPDLPGWVEVIDDSMRRITRRDTRGPVLRLAFSPEPFIEYIGGRPIFSIRSDLKLMHLSHPMFQKALSSLTRRRFPGTGEGVSRWSVRLGDVPDGMDGLVLLSVEELAVNELRESFHHWIRTIAIPIQNGRIGKPLPHKPASAYRGVELTFKPEHYELAQRLLDDVEPELRNFLREYGENLTSELKSQIELDYEQARKHEDERYRSRQGEVSSLITENTLARLEREVEELKVERMQGVLFDQEERLDRIDRSIEEKEAEIERRKNHYEEIRDQLTKERERIMDFLLPKRYALSGDAQVFPVCLEVRLPGGGS